LSNNGILRLDDLLLLEQYRVSSLLTYFDTFTQVHDIQADELRYDLFLKYLSEAKSRLHFDSLCELFRL
ncbi:unnamed protein product, partial [Didymodactylos carnosus]